MPLTTAQIQNAYVAFFNRPADVAGLNYWSTYAGNSADLLNTFAQSAEYKGLYANMNSTQIVNAVYTNLFGRTPEVSGLNYWVTQLDNGNLKVGNVADAINKGSQGTDATIISNKVTAATAFTNGLDTSAKIVAYAGVNSTGLTAVKNWLAAVTSDAATLTSATSTSGLSTIITTVQSNVASSGSTFTLTTGADNVTGTSGNDTITGVASATAGESTLNLADVVDGGAGTDTMKLIVSGAVNMPGSEIKNVENFELKDLTGGNTHSFAGVTGEAQVLVTASTGNTTVTNLDKAVVGVKDVTGAAATQTFTFKDSAFASTAALDVAVENAGNKVAGNRQTLDIKIASTAGAANAVNVAATGSNFITFASSGTDISAAAGIKTLTVTGAGTLDIAAAADAGGGALATNLTTVDLSKNSGGVTMQVDKTTVVVTGGSGADVISVGGAMTSGAKFNLGAGNDQLLKAGGSVDANVVVDAGEGTDTIDNGLITVANGGIFKNFENIALSTANTTDIELLTGSTIKGLLVNTGDVVGVVAQNVATGSTIEVTAVDVSQTGTLTAAVKGAAASTTDVMNISFNGAAQAATPTAYNIAGGTMTIANVETINVASGGADNTWNQLALTADKAKVVAITGAKNLDLTFGATGTNPVAGQGGAVSSIDGSAATGKLAITLTNVVYDDKVGIIVKGGTGNDTITTNTSSATLTGTGGNDKFVVTATVAASVADATTSATKMTTITDINAGDSIDFGSLTSLTKAQTDVATATNLTNAINLALENAAVNAAGKAAWFVYGGNTYIVDQLAADTVGAANDFTAVDIVVKLTGSVDLTNATIAANVLTIV